MFLFCKSNFEYLQLFIFALHNIRSGLISVFGKEFKIFKSDNFNNYFNKRTGLNITFGKTKDEDPEFSPFGPLIADIEISTICHGVKSKEGINTPCKFCYKANTSRGKNMTLEEFKNKMREEYGL